MPLIANTGTASTAHSVELTKAAEDVGVDAALVVTPYYNRPSQAGIEAHLRAIAAATDLPVIVYDIPKRTGREVRPGHAPAAGGGRCDRRGQGCGRFAGGTAALVAGRPPSFEVYSGEDALTLPLLAVGAVGVISVASHWAGVQMSEMVAAFTKGDTEAAMALNARLVESWEFEASDEAPNPVPTKAMLRALGLPGGDCRLPMGPNPKGLVERARASLEPSPRADLPAGRLNRAATA